MEAAGMEKEVNFRRRAQPIASEKRGQTMYEDGQKVKKSEAEIEKELAAV
jgi:hypothetical protein